MLTVSSLLDDCGIELTAGQSAGERSVRWVAISEHEDPTPWLSGGEVLLTTGYNLDSAKKQRDYVARISKHEVAALGFGIGFDHKKLPAAIRDAAEKHGMPLFEVPYEMPFIAITERAATRLVHEGYDTLARGSKVHEQLERLVIDGGGLDKITAAIAGAVGGSALVFDVGLRQVARHPSQGVPRADDVGRIAEEIAGRLGSGGVGATPFEPETLPDRGLVVPVPGRRGAPPVGWLAVVSERGPLGEFERLIARQASIVVGLELMRERVVNETERRLAGDLLADALSGRLDPDELAGRLRPFGIGADASVMVFSLADPPAAEVTLESHLSRAGVPALVATASATGGTLLCAVVSTGADDPVSVAREARIALITAHSEVRAAASRSVPVASLRRAFHEARCALEATSLQNGGGPDVASHRDLGAFTLLLALQDDEALRLYSEGLLEPIGRNEGEYGGELLRSLEAFIENNGNWERAARQLYCHRHTLRYRIRKIEELTGRDLSRATDRIELWLALRARELVR
ncbi:MAG: PucR family transcriptional regulator ligand-binding domain-containing protein [Actinomycetota bacterium]|nr:PucR family transcriptional regulator ligand-binding domain-containing protein [Actinomycetota bacterium]